MNAADRRAIARAELLGALEALDALTALVAEGERPFAENSDRQAHVRYLWIVIGSRLKNYCESMDIPRAAGVLGQAIGFRHTLAYSRPDRIHDSIVWRTSTSDLASVREAVAEMLDALAT